MATGFDLGRCLQDIPSPDCVVAARLNTFGVTSAAVAPAAPTHLTAQVSGSTVTLNWLAPSGEQVSSYNVEAGSASGLANLANFSTGNASTSLQANGVGPGAYFVRVRAQTAGGIGPTSNEVLLTVGSVGCFAPGPASGLRVTSQAGGTVAFAWNAGSGATTYVIEAGSVPGAINLANSDLGSGAVTFQANGVGAGTYYVRLRSKNACGTSGVSNEVSFTIGSVAPTPTPTPQPTPTPSPTPTSVSIFLFGGSTYGAYLGCWSCSEYDVESIFNQYGRFGSRYSTTSIWNPYGTYGSPYSIYSACNPYASQPPVLIGTNYVIYGELTLNAYRSRAITAPAILTWLRTAVCS